MINISEYFSQYKVYSHSSTATTIPVPKKELVFHSRPFNDLVQLMEMVKELIR